MSLLLVDANNIHYRAYHASRGDMSVDGVPTGPMVIFINSLAGIIKDIQPDKVALCWDGGKSKFRTALLDSYKANRDPVPPPDLWDARTLTQTLLALCGVPQVSRQGYEADDLIAGFWREAKEPVVIVSNDKDFTQLCGLNPHGHNTQLLRLSNVGGATELWEESDVVGHYGCEPRYIPLLLALWGDKSDNIPGVPGVGPKKGLKIMQDCNFSAADVFRHPKVMEYASEVRRNLFLTNLRAPLEGMDLRPIKEFTPVDSVHEDWEDLENFLKQYKLEVIRQRILENRYWERAEGTFGG